MSLLLMAAAASLPFNVATGGNTVTDVPNYNGTGQTWRTHLFTSDGALTVVRSMQEFSVLAIGGGGGGGNSNNSTRQGGPGGRGEAVESSVTLGTGASAVDVGAGGAGGIDEYTTAGGGATTTFSTVSAIGGGGGGWCSSIAADGTPGTNQSQVSSDIRGAGAETWAGPDGYGLGGAQSFLPPGGAGAAGAVIIAYQIG